MGRKSRKPSRKRRSSLQRRRIQLEMLEPRLLLAADPGNELPFASAFRSGVEEIERVLGAVEQTTGMQTPMPWLRARQPESAGALPAMQEITLADLFDLRSRFQTQIVDPVVEFIESHPTATASDLA
ncbi:MAG TPA: LEPR-XLL domain-containing protein, partial [Planctomycetaceae bacterium]|nr:LEPR-XLL domain-containing protein [Planctomycetaceae bacterium]